MLRICVYKGFGMYEKDGIILHRVLSKYVCSKKYSVCYLTPEDILSDALDKNTSLFVIGGGFDLGLIKELGQSGMSKIKDYVTKGGSYLGICSGAYFACDYIEFDKGGPFEVIGKRFLKFYPGHSHGPLYKPYDYQTRKGAAPALIKFKPNMIPGSEKDGYTNKTGYLDGILQQDESLVSNGTNQTYSHMKDATNNVCGSLVNGVPVTGWGDCLITDTSNGHGDVNSDDVQVTDKGHAAPTVNGTLPNDLSKGTGRSRLFKVYFNGGGFFIGKHQDVTLPLKQIPADDNDTESQHFTESPVQNESQLEYKDQNGKESSEKQTNGISQGHHNKDGITDPESVGFENVTVLARYWDLESRPAAIVKCRVGEGTAVLSGTHFEYDGEDIDDGDELVKDIVPVLNNSKVDRKYLFLSILKDLNVTTLESL